jgi:hypothetical protein
MRLAENARRRRLGIMNIGGAAFFSFGSFLYFSCVLLFADYGDRSVALHCVPVFRSRVGHRALFTWFSSIVCDGDDSELIDGGRGAWLLRGINTRWLEKLSTLFFLLFFTEFWFVVGKKFDVMSLGRTLELNVYMFYMLASWISLHWN